MKARIIKVNYQLERAMFERADGEYGWLEILDSTELEEDEIVSGDFLSLGGTTIRNEDNKMIEVFIEDFCSQLLALSHVFPDRKH
jgi:hypothetical protein